MITFDYHISQSTISGAGKGLFSNESIEEGRVLIAPSNITETISREALDTLGEQEAESSIRWFEDAYTISTDWPDECYINHSFTPNGLWHLGFVFAQRRIEKGDEILIDYRYLLAPGMNAAFLDTSKNQTITGFTWEENITTSTACLMQILKR